jgi:multidrug efflux pump
MNLPRYFIDRPIFAAVISIVIAVAGLLALPRLPIAQYPDVVPPSVVVRAQYPGANPKVISETVAAPLEQEINGVENMLYMSSTSTADGSFSLTITFRVGTDVDTAQVQVQNRVSQALPRLPDTVRTLGVTTIKSSPDLALVVQLLSPDGRYDTLYLRNYAVLQVRDALRRIPGVGEVRLIGAGDYAMRIWLDPQKVASRNLTAGDVVRAIREQNVQVAAGLVGAQPSPKDVEYQLTVSTTGRLASEQEFGDIVVKTGTDGSVTRLRDVARIELGAGTYAVRSTFSGQTGVGLPIAQGPDANALELSDAVHATMAELSKNFPEGMTYKIEYDPTQAVRQGIHAVVETLLEAILLVVIVVVLFLQTWRASIIPLLAVPVSVIGTFAFLFAFGFSINALTLFGLVLAIGIVVDDAIVVVENVERNIEHGMAPREATYRAMAEVSGPIVAIALVLCAVFVPIAFISGLTGQFYRQFALTIAISTVISAFNSLTLSPALAAALLKPRDAPPDRLTIAIDRYLGWLFRPFDRVFRRGSERYATGVGRVLSRKAAVFGVYGVLLVMTVLAVRLVPTGFIPTQDKGFLISFLQLPDAASLNRTDAVVQRATEIALAQPGVQYTVAFSGMSIKGFSNATNSGIVFIGLKPYEERTSKELGGFAIARNIARQFGPFQDATTGVFPPPAVQGLGTIGGFTLQLEDRGGVGYDELYRTANEVVERARKEPALAGVFTSYSVNTPQLIADVDRTRVKEQGVQLTDVFETMQVYLGSIYVNDFNLFGRTYQVVAQADAPFRATPESIGQLKTRNSTGDMVPLASLVRVREAHGPDRVFRYNGYLTADVNGGPAPGYSSGQAQAAIERVLAETLPNGVKFEWTDLTYQQILSGNTMVYVFPLCVLFVFLVLAALYESWTLPLAIILIVPLCVLFAMIGVKVTGGDNNVFTQIALFVLVGLACKNAILIVEFAELRRRAGATVVEAAIEAARLRLRPILMTSMAFIMGVVPLVFASGAGAEMRHAIGVAVFSGMLGVTLFGLFLTPLFYVVVERIAERLGSVPAPMPPPRPD